MHKKLSLFFILCSLLILSCQKSSTLTLPQSSSLITSSSVSNLSASDQYIVDIFSSVGAIHNKALDYVYNQLDSLTNDPNFDTVPLKQLNEIIFDYLQDSLQVSGLPLTGLYFSDTAIKNQGFSSTPISTNVELWTGTQLTSKMKNALAAFESIMWNDSINEQYYKYDSLINAIVPTLGNNQDKATFTATVSVGKMSRQYWDINEAKWDSLANLLESRYYGSSKISSKVSSAGKDILYADCAGAVTGAVRGAFVGAAGGTMTVPGVGTVAGAACCGLVGMAGGAIGGSAAEAIHSTIKWLLDW